MESKRGSLKKVSAFPGKKDFDAWELGERNEARNACKDVLRMAFCRKDLRVSVQLLIYSGARSFFSAHGNAEKLDVDVLRLDDPCILFALSRERAAFCREIRPHQTFAGAPCWAKFCGPAWLTVLVMETGIGAESVATAMDWLLAKPTLEGVPYEPKVILFAGFAGALTEQLHVGDVLLADEVVNAQGQSGRPTWPSELPEGEWKPPLHRGRLLTMNRLIGTAEEKRRLGEEYRACAVDMESALFAERCTKAGVPFACLRAISDEVATPLSPELTSLLSGGAASPWRVVRALARHPSLLPDLLRLARDTKRASGPIGVGRLGELLTLTLPWEL